jgi:hypothetical protein
MAGRLSIDRTHILADALTVLAHTHEHPSARDSGIIHAKRRPFLHGVVFAPAILVLASAPLMAGHGWTYALLFGAAPVALVWSALRFWWPGR